MSRIPFVQRGGPYPFLEVRIVVTRQDTGRREVFTENCKVDTGFYADIFMPSHYQLAISQLGVPLYDTPLILADGKEVSAKACYAHVEKIDDHEFPAPGIDIALFCHGNPKNPLLGLRLLNKWIAELDGPRQILSLFSPA